jgi:hypothetical protein
MRSLVLAPLLVTLGAAAATPPAAAAAKPVSVLPFVEDNLDKALSEAKARKLPIFVEAWAPW